MAHRQTNYINKHATACCLYSTQSVLGFWRLRVSLTSASASVLGSPRLLRSILQPVSYRTINFIVPDVAVEGRFVSTSGSNYSSINDLQLNVLFHMCIGPRGRSFGGSHELANIANSPHAIPVWH